MATGSANKQGVPCGIDQRTQECLSLIKNGNHQANVILLLGRTGAGKSSLLEDITGAGGHSKDGNEKDIVTSKIQIEEATIDQRQYFIMDTPGFDMGKGKEVFYKINGGIQEVREHTRTWGILYVTKIDSRVETIDENLLEFIRRFSGEGFFRNITCVTTHWNWRHEDEKRVRNTRLEERKGLWGNYLQNQARMYHHGRKVIDGVDTDDFFCWYDDRNQIAQSAKSMVSLHYGNAEPRTPLFVQELNEGTATHKTTAGSFLDPPSLQTFLDDYGSFREDPGVSWDEGPAESRQSFSDRALNEDARAHEQQPPSPPPPPPQPAPNTPSPEPDFLSRFASGLGDLTELTFEGPAVGIRNGKVSFNVSALTSSALQALSHPEASPAPNHNQDPSIVNFLDARGIPSDLGSRRRMAADLGMDPEPIGTEAGNTLLLNLLRALGW